MKREAQKAQTRKRIQDALVDLIRDKNLDKITIKELAEKADVDRKTFYMYFETILDVFYSIELDLLKELEVFYLSSELAPEKRLEVLFEKIEAFILKNLDLLKELNLKSGQSTFSSNAAKLFLDEIKMFWSREGISFEDSVRLDFYASGIAGVYINWIRAENPVPIKKLRGPMLELIKSFPIRQ